MIGENNGNQYENPKKKKVELSPKELEKAKEQGEDFADAAFYHTGNVNDRERMNIPHAYLKIMKEVRDFKNLTGNEPKHIDIPKYGELYTAENFNIFNKQFEDEKNKAAAKLLQQAEEIEKRAELRRPKEQEIKDLVAQKDVLNKEIEKKDTQIEALLRQDGGELSDAYEDAKYMRGVYERQKIFIDHAVAEIGQKLDGNYSAEVLKEMAAVNRLEAQKLYAFNNPQLN